MSEEIRDRFEDWLSANSSFRYHAHGGEPQIDQERARLRLLERIGQNESREKPDSSLLLVDPDNTHGD